MMPLKWGVLRVRLAHDDWSTLTGKFNNVNVHVISSTPIPGKDRIIGIVEVSSDNIKMLKEFLMRLNVFTISIGLRLLIHIHVGVGL
jgi:hypothetical protein